MLRLSSISKVPPGGFRYRHPVSGVEFNRHAWALLRGDVTAHTEGNGFPAVSDEEIQAQLCGVLGEAADRFCEGEGRTARGVGWHWREIANGTLALGSFLLNGRKRVEPVEAERRASICAACPLNSVYSKPCGGDCPELRAAVQFIVGGAATSQDARLEACGVCGCDNRAQVWVPVESLALGAGNDFTLKAPNECWKRAALLNRH